MATSLIHLENVIKSFGSTPVLKGISGSINTGDVLAILGPSGSGKSTLLRCINLLETPTSGQIFLKNEEITHKDFNPEKMRLKVGMVFQNFHLFPHLTALENVSYAPEKVLKKKKEEARGKAFDLLERVGLKDKADFHPNKLSGGQKQRVAIARCLAMDPEVILFDEPTSALDPEMVKEVLDVIKSLVATKITSLLVTHEMAFAREVANKVWFMDQGLLIEEANPQAFFQSPKSHRAKSFLEKVL